MKFLQVQKDHRCMFCLCDKKYISIIPLYPEFLCSIFLSCLNIIIKIYVIKFF